MSLYSVIADVRELMIENKIAEDTPGGVSATDGIPANSINTGDNVQGTGAGAKGEPGVYLPRQRRRRKYRLQRHARRRRAFRESQLYQDFNAPGEIDVADYDRQGNLKPVNERFTPVDPEVKRLRIFQNEVVDRYQAPMRNGDKPRKKRKLKDGSKIHVNPQVNDHPRVGEDLAVRMASWMGGNGNMGYLKEVILDPQTAVDDPELQPHLVDLADKVFTLIRDDSQMYNRLKTILREGACA